MPEIVPKLSTLGPLNRAGSCYDLRMTQTQSITGTVQMADGTRRAARSVDGEVAFATFGNANSAAGHSYRKASPKQAKTFTPDAPEADERAAHDEARELLSQIAVDGRPAAVTELLVAAELVTDAAEHLRQVREAVALDARLRAYRR